MAYKTTPNLLLPFPRFQVPVLSPFSCLFFFNLRLSSTIDSVSGQNQLNYKFYHRRHQHYETLQLDKLKDEPDLIFSLQLVCLL